MFWFCVAIMASFAMDYTAGHSPNLPLPGIKDSGYPSNGNRGRSVGPAPVVRIIAAFFDAPVF
jgi:hypothetical protein